MSARGRSRRLVVVWALLAALIGAIVYAERVDLMSLWLRTDDGHLHNNGPRDLVTLPLDQFGALEVVYQGTVHRFERDAQGQPDWSWVAGKPSIRLETECPFANGVPQRCRHDVGS